MLSTQSHKYEPLQDGEDLPGEGPPSINTNIWRRRFYVLLSISTLTTTILCGVVAWLLVSLNRGPKIDVKVPYSPASLELRYENRYLTQDPDTPSFMGRPRPEMDQAWHDLLEGTLIRYSHDELRLAGNASSVAHRQGGYVGGLGISHSLHCLKRIKQYMYPEYYYAHEDQDWDELESHADHCVESIRQVLLCQPDVSVYTLEWTSHSRFKPAVRVPQAHACVDWSRLHEWMKSRAARLDDMVPPDPALYETGTTHKQANVRP